MVGIISVHQSYTNQQYDKESGLYYYNARYYDPHLGSFLTPDPGMSGLNHYAYANSNPIRYSDPTGLSWWGYEGSTLVEHDDDTGAIIDEHIGNDIAGGTGTPTDSGGGGGGGDITPLPGPPGSKLVTLTDGKKYWEFTLPNNMTDRIPVEYPKGKTDPVKDEKEEEGQPGTVTTTETNTSPTESEVTEKEKRTLYFSFLKKSSTITTEWGPRIHPITGNPDFHLGWDVDGDDGDPIYVPAKLNKYKVTLTYDEDYNEGHRIFLHFLINNTAYKIKIAHCDPNTRNLKAVKKFLKTGKPQKVKAGQLIAYMGHSGYYCRGSHAHVEIEVYGLVMPPDDFYDLLLN